MAPLLLLFDENRFSGLNYEPRPETTHPRLSWEHSQLSSCSTCELCSTDYLLRTNYCRLQNSWRWLNFDRFLRTSTAQLVSLITHERGLKPHRLYNENDIIFIVLGRPILISTLNSACKMVRNLNHSGTHLVHLADSTSTNALMPLT